MPRYEVLGNGIRVYFSALQSALIEESNAQKGQNGTLDVPLAVTLENKILKIILDNSQKNLTQVAEDLNISYRTIKRIIKHLREENKIVRIGGKRFGHWKVK